MLKTTLIQNNHQIGLSSVPADTNSNDANQRSKASSQCIMIPQDMESSLESKENFELPHSALYRKSNALNIHEDYKS